MAPPGTPENRSKRSVSSRRTTSLCADGDLSCWTREDGTVAPRGRTTGPELTDWMSAREPWLQRTAHLLVGDVDRAQPLVLDTLARLQLSWSRVGRGDDIDTEARRLLVGSFRKATRSDPAADERAVL